MPRTRSGIVSSMVTRMTEPKRRRRTNCSMVSRRSSASSSWMASSASRVTRNACDSSTSMPGNSDARLAAMTCSSHVNHCCSTPSSFSSAFAGGTHGHEPRQRVRHLDAREPLVAVGVAEQHPEVVAHVGDVRERAARVERQRREHREDLVLVVAPQRGALPRVEVGVVDDVDAGRLELGPEVAEALARRLHDAPGALLREGQQLLRRVAVGRGLGHAGLDLLPQAGDAHHEELAEDRPDDADELDALEEGVVRCREPRRARARRSRAC